MSNTRQKMEFRISAKKQAYCKIDLDEKSLNQFKNGLTWIGRLCWKQGQETNLSKTKKMQEALKDIFKNKIKLIKKKVWYTKKCTCKCKKKKDYLKKD